MIIEVERKKQKQNNKFADIVPELLVEEGEGGKRKHTLSKKLAEKATSTISVFAEELENVIHMASTHHQFAYEQKIDEEDSSSEKTESTMASRNPTVVDLKRMASVCKPVDVEPPALRRAFSSPNLV